jgi:hypothetical protein
MIFGIYEDGVVRARGHAGLAANANRFIEINYAVSAFEHRGSGAGSNTRRMRALIAAGHLVRAARLRKDPYIDMLDVGPRH